MFVKIIFAGILIDSMRKLINSGMKEFYIRDNNGYILCFAEEKK